MEQWSHGGGFSLDATVRIEANDRRGLERLLRYCARPPFAAERIDKSQRDYLLRQQLEAIKKELGEDADASSDYRQQLADLDAPDAVREAIEREIDRLERMSDQSPEHSWIRTWLDTVVDIPWETTTDDDLDMGRAREVLDADHTGLDEVKELKGAQLEAVLEYTKMAPYRGKKTGKGFYDWQ